MKKISYMKTVGRCWNCFEQMKKLIKGKFLCKACLKKGHLKMKCKCNHEKFRHSKVNAMCLVADCNCKFFMDKPKKVNLYEKRKS